MPLGVSAAGLKVTMGRRRASSAAGDGPPTPDRVSHESWCSGTGVLFGVVFVLSTRTCLAPDRGVMLLLMNADTGDTTSPLSRGTVLLLLSARSGLGPRLASGVETGGFWCCGVDARDATLGVRGGLLIPLDTGMVGRRLLLVVLSYGILAAVRGCSLESKAGFRGRLVAATFWSRTRRG